MQDRHSLVNVKLKSEQFMNIVCNEVRTVKLANNAQICRFAIRCNIG